MDYHGGLPLLLMRKTSLDQVKFRKNVCFILTSNLYVRLTIKAANTDV